MPFGIIQTRRPRRPPGQKTAVKGIVPGKLPKNSLPFEASASRRFSRNDSSGQTRRTHSPSKASASRRFSRNDSSGQTRRTHSPSKASASRRFSRNDSSGQTQRGRNSPRTQSRSKRALRAASPGTTPTARPKGSGLRTHSLPKNDRMNGYISMICWLATSS
jgi:hypothetical protein